MRARFQERPARCLRRIRLQFPAAGSANLTATINVPNNATAGAYNFQISTHDTSGAPSHAFTVSLTVAEDFLVTSSTSSQTVNAGQTSGPYSLTIQPVGSSFNSAVTLSCSGLPALAQCLFNPSTPVTPGNSAVDVVLNISTSTGDVEQKSSPTGRRSTSTLWWLLPALSFGLLIGRSPRKRRLLVLGANAFLSLALVAVLVSCSGVSNGGGGGGGGGCSAVPSVPLGLTATSTTASGTTLNWNASSAIAGCSVTGYPVYQGTTLLASPTTTTYAVTGLSPGTQYSFTVAARDSFGASGPEYRDQCHDRNRGNAARYLHHHGERHFAGSAVRLRSEHTGDSRRTLGRYLQPGLDVGCRSY